MPQTAKAVPYPAIGDDNANHDSIKAIADRLDTILSARTAAQINALAPGELWTGRLLRQTDSHSASPPIRGPRGLYVYHGSMWKPVSGTADSFKLATSPTLTAVSVNPNMGTSPTLAWDWWMLGHFVIGWSYYKWGTGSPSTGTGALRVNVPLGMATDEPPGLGYGLAIDASTGDAREISMNPAASGGTACELWADTATSAATGSSLVVGAAGDEILLEWMYEWSGS